MTTTTYSTQEPALVGGARTRLVRHSTGFWVIAIAFTAMMAFTTVPTPLYAIYQRRDGFPTVVITAVFALYAVGVILALFFVGHLSDRLGRRRVVVAAAVIELVAAVMFLAWTDPGGLMAARFVSGVGVGILTATATAYLADLHAIAHPDRSRGFATTIAGVANLGGLALGPLIGGFIAEWVARPIVVSYALFIVVILGTGVLATFVPETVRTRETPFRYHPQRVSAPRGSRTAYWAAGAGAFTSFAVTGLFGSVAPTFLAIVLGESDRLVSGATAFSVFAAAALAQVVFSGFSPRLQLEIGVVAMIGGLAALGIASVTASTVFFFGGGIIAGIGVGLLFRGALATAGSLATDQNRGEVLAGIFLLAYAGMTIPPLLVGVALLFIPIVPVFLGFVVVALALTMWAGPSMVLNSAQH